MTRLLSFGWTKLITTASVEPTQVNGRPGLILRLDGELEGVVSMQVEDGLITGLYIMRNPEKLSHVERKTTLSRSPASASQR